MVNCPVGDTKAPFIAPYVLPFWLWNGLSEYRNKICLCTKHLSGFYSQSTVTNKYGKWQFGIRLLFQTSSKDFPPRYWARTTQDCPLLVRAGTADQPGFKVP